MFETYVKDIKISILYYIHTILSLRVLCLILNYKQLLFTKQTKML